MLVFLNNDTEVILENWLTILVGDYIQPGVGVVGVKLYYPDMLTVQMIVGIWLTPIAGRLMF